MKHKLTKHELLGSLAYPVGIMLWTAFEYIRGSMLLGDLAPHFMYRWSYIITFAVCGAVPLALTLIMRIDTSDCFLPRLVIWLSAVAAISIAGELLDYEIMVLAEGIFLLIALVFSGLFFHVAKPTRLSQWIMIFMANPCLVYLVCYAMRTYELKQLIEYFVVTY